MRAWILYKLNAAAVGQLRRGDESGLLVWLVDNQIAWLVRARVAPPRGKGPPRHRAHHYVRDADGPRRPQDTSSQHSANNARIIFLDIDLEAETQEILMQDTISRSI